MAKKKVAKKPKARPQRGSSKGRAAPRRAARKTPARKAGSTVRSPTTGRKSGPRRSWLDDSAQTPIIDQYARQLSTFIDAMADGRIDASELEAQESRLVDLMKKIEPRLDDSLHEQVTRLLCEVTAFDIMHILHAMSQAGQQREFRG